jgi:ribosomal protein S8
MKLTKIQDFLLRLKTAAQKKMLKFDTPSFIGISKILLDLYSVGFIQGYTIKNKKLITIYLKYDTYGLSILRTITLISHKSTRIYINNKQIGSLLHQYNYLWVLIKTSKGLINHRAAYKLCLGGELVAFIK